MKNTFVKYKLELIGVVVGAFAGWCYWYFVGCASGTCAITSSAVNSSLYGAMVGGIFLSIFKRESQQENTKK